MSVTIAMVLEYDGGGFCGWQVQPGGIRTIQEELSKAIKTFLRCDIGHLSASGRTDSGVHAKKQVVSFTIDSVPDLKKLTYGVSSILKGEVSIVKACIVPDTFHARASALSKKYKYTILYREAPAALDKGRVWHLRGPLDIELMIENAKSLEGTHDFTSFRAAGCMAKSPVREIFQSNIIWKAPYLTYEVIGEGFLKQMVRNIVGTLVDSACGKLERSFAEVLAAKDRRAGGVTAPGMGLCLEWVEYPLEFMELLGYSIGD